MSRTHAHTGEQSLRSRLSFETHRQHYLVGAALLLALATHLADVATTAIGLSAGIAEGHPLTAYMFETVGFALWNAISLAIVVGWALLAREIARRLWPVAADQTVIAVLVAFALWKMMVLGWNLRALWAAGVIG